MRFWQRTGLPDTLGVGLGTSRQGGEEAAPAGGNPTAGWTQHRPAWPQPPKGKEAGLSTLLLSLTGGRSLALDSGIPTALHTGRAGS